MNFKSRFWRWCLVLGIVFFLSPTMNLTQAQINHCFGITSADCQLFQNAISPDDLSKLTSFVSDYALIFKITGWQSRDIDLKIKGKGSFSLSQGFSADLVKSLEGVLIDSTAHVQLAEADTTTDELVNWRVVTNTLYTKTNHQDSWLSIDLR